MTAIRYRMLDAALGRGALPDVALSTGARLGAGWRERREARGGIEGQEVRMQELLARMTSGAIAEVPQKANEQHYELPADFFSLMLGPRRKYSSALWDPSTASLAEAEEAMLDLSCRRVQIQDGMRILDLGCGWGSLSLWLAERYPTAHVTGVSNSNAQRRWIEGEACARGLSNLEIVTADINVFAPETRFDRVMSIEMFEHLRNWEELLRRISTWLVPDGALFIHVFSHRTMPYQFESTWAAERFFTAGLMPSHDLLLHFQRDLEVADRWAFSGHHYAKTLTAWRERLDERADEALAVLAEIPGARGDARVLLGRWRLFLIATAQLWGYKRGEAWMLSHYLMRPRGMGA
jgi:cyclopropane-fatty-acyl-phospholipid synthase